MAKQQAFLSFSFNEEKNDVLFFIFRTHVTRSRLLKKNEKTIGNFLENSVNHIGYKSIFKITKDAYESKIKGHIISKMYTLLIIYFTKQLLL